MEHIWVSLQFTPVDVEQAADGVLTVTATEAALELSEEHALMACYLCDTPLTTESFGSECVPEAAAKAI